MSITILRTPDAWWVHSTDSAAGGAARIDTDATTTGELLAHAEQIEAARGSKPTLDPAALDLVSPVTAPCRVVAQMTNFASHVNDAGLNPDTIPLTFFRKTSGSISGPFDDIVRPTHVRFLDYGACREITCRETRNLVLHGSIGYGQGLQTGAAGSADAVAGGHALLAS